MYQEISNLAYKSMNACRLLALSTSICSKEMMLSDIEAIAQNIAKMKQLIEEQNNAISS